MFDLVPRSWGGGRSPEKLLNIYREWEQKAPNAHGILQVTDKSQRLPPTKHIHRCCRGGCCTSLCSFIFQPCFPLPDHPGSLYSLSCLRLIRTLGSELFSPARFRLFSPLCSLQAIMSSLPPSPRVYLCSVCCCVCVCYQSWISMFQRR